MDDVQVGDDVVTSLIGSDDASNHDVTCHPRTYDGPSSSSHQNHLASSPNTASWDQAPQDVLLNVFKYLSNKDLCTVSTVCEQWLELSRAPCLWRTKHLLFSSNEMVLKTVPKHLQFLDTLGHHLRHLSVEAHWWKEEFSSLRDLEELLEKVSHVAELRSLSFRLDVELTDDMRRRVLRCLCALLETQIYLRVVQLDCCLQLTLAESAMVLEALSHGQHHQRKWLTSVDVHDLHMPYGRFLSRVLVSSFAQLVGIRSVCLDWRALDAAVIRTITASSSLQKMKIVVDTIHEPSTESGPISARDWREAVKRCPRLEVEVTFIGVESFDGIRRVLAAGMPLTEVTTCGWLGRSNVVDRLLTHLAQFYTATLAVVNLKSWPWPQPGPTSADDGLLRLVRDCRQLRVVHVDIPLTIQPHTLDSVDAAMALRQNQEQGNLQMLLAVDSLPRDMKSPDYTAERWPWLHTALHTDSWAQRHCSLLH